ncbi:MAG TPA: RNA 2',3'-cyclic phosphodiesterase [Steroidobacteraceae bacterium]|nr:RNA 2',3'-cyclic phosphodiesterase [Steroidobacteraceae bacterium]
MSDGPHASQVAPGLRMFYALRPDQPTQTRIAAAAHAIAWADSVRLVPAENYHLTIAFVGEIGTERLPLLRRIGAHLRAASCTIEFDRTEYWPKPAVVVAAAREIPAALEYCWRALHQDLARHDFQLDPKRLRPHVTLARKVAQAPVLTPIGKFAWCASDFCLMRSSAGGAQPVYTVLDTWPLLDEGENSSKSP